MSEKISSTENDAGDFRARLGTRLVFISTIALVLLAITMVGASAYKGDGDTVLDTAQLLLSSLLPLFATWVGTILAFYYTKENYQAATQGTLDIVKSIDARLATKKASDVMLPRHLIAFEKAINNGIDEISISSIKEKFGGRLPGGNRVSRLHFFDDKDTSLAIMHRSIFFEMLSVGLQNENFDATTAKLRDLVENNYESQAGKTFRALITGTTAFVAENATLAEANAAMKAKPGCQDVIVTKTGSASEPVLGWVTNIDINRHSVA